MNRLREKRGARLLLRIDGVPRRQTSFRVGLANQSDQYQTLISANGVETKSSLPCQSGRAALLNGGRRARLADHAAASGDLAANRSACRIHRPGPKEGYAGSEDGNRASRTLTGLACAVARASARKLRCDHPLPQRTVPAQAINVIHGIAHPRRANGHDSHDVAPATLPAAILLAVRPAGSDPFAMFKPFCPVADHISFS